MDVVVTAEARTTRREFGQTAWAVFEDLLVDAEFADDRLVVESNVRRIAANVGVSKDTAARAVARLVKHGVVKRVDTGRGESGAFARAAYAIDLTRVAGITVASLVCVHAPATASTTSCETHTGATPAPTRARRTSRHASDVDDAQTSLFDLPASVS